MEVKKGDLLRWCPGCRAFVSERHIPHPSIFHSYARFDATVNLKD